MTNSLTAKRECDLVMKGGLTSGVVYPKAIVEISKSYRLRSIGGTSAGAIAAVMAAAAEYRRQSSIDQSDCSGFAQIEDIGESLGRDMRGLFQPDRPFKQLFKFLTEFLKGKDVDGNSSGQPTNQKSKRLKTVRALVHAAISAYPFQFGLGVLIGAVNLLDGWADQTAATKFLDGIGLIVFPIMLIAISIAWTVFKKLPKNDFGLCSGATQNTSKDSTVALTEWLADHIDRVALGLDSNTKPTGAPLTIGDLKPQGINVACMTTDLSAQRPYQLPLKTRDYFFSKSEFEKLFPPRIVDYLTSALEKEDLLTGPDSPSDLYRLPVEDKFPLVLVARMSLSFPGLISAIPLYREDYKATKKAGARVMRRHLYSDGGISSNFPIHLFDALIPSRPTLGITLSAWDEERHGDTRVHLSADPTEIESKPPLRISKLSGFLFSILNTAKNWQDTLQARLPGYAERIVEIRLDNEKEGGINLQMSNATIEQLVGYGELAGKSLVNKFEFDEHRYRRALSLLPKLETSLRRYAQTYDAKPVGSSAEDMSFKDILTQHPAQHYENKPPWREEHLLGFAQKVHLVGEQINDTYPDDIPTDLSKGTLPSHDANIRVIASADRVPKRSL